MRAQAEQEAKAKAKAEAEAIARALEQLLRFPTPETVPEIEEAFEALLQTTGLTQAPRVDVQTPGAADTVLALLAKNSPVVLTNTGYFAGHPPSSAESVCSYNTLTFPAPSRLTRAWRGRGVC